MTQGSADLDNVPLVDVSASPEAAPEAAVAPEFAHDAEEQEPAPVGEAEPSYVPITQSQRSFEPPAEAQPQEHHPLPSAAVESSEPPMSESRRRSTVREPAPAAPSDEATAATRSYQTPGSSPEPVVSSSAASDAGDRPRRSGWWSRRALDKG